MSQSVRFGVRVSWLVAVVFVAGTTVAAQRTWIVDPESRPGFDFADLPPAIAASAPGDTIKVRGSTTRPVNLGVSTSKGLTIIGEGAAHYYFGWPGVHSVPPHQRLVVRDFSAFTGWTTNPPTMDAGIAIYDCFGSVSASPFPP